MIKTTKANSITNKQSSRNGVWGGKIFKGHQLQFWKQAKEAHATTCNPTSAIRHILFGVYLVALHNWTITQCLSHSHLWRSLHYAIAVTCGWRGSSFVFASEGAIIYTNKQSQYAAMWTFPELLPDSPNHLLPEIDIIRTKCPIRHGRNNLVVRR